MATLEATGRGISRGIAACVVAAAAGALALAAPRAGEAQMLDTPRIEGPVTGGARGRPFTSATFDLGALGYVEEEYFLDGEAATYAPAPGTALGSDGRWQLVETGRQPYRTRLLVRRPRSDRDFDGTVVVEWLNVTGGWDIDAVWAQVHTEVVRSGHAWVGVSAQRAAVNGPPVLPGVSQPLTTWDPERYGSLDIPDDALSYDVFSQAASVLGRDRPRGAVDPLGGLRVRRLIATGASQSAHRLATYVNGVHPRARAFDGYLAVVRFGRGAALAADVPSPDVLLVRSDLDVPLLAVNTETEALASFPARQPDSATHRYWEIAGAAHQGTYVDATIDAQIRRDLGFELPACDPPGNSMPAHHVLNAALAQLDRWIGARATSAARLSYGRSGPGTAGDLAPRSAPVARALAGAPPSFPPIEIAGTPPAIVRDEHGNARGGIRLPALVVPTAQYGPVGAPQELRCDLRGFTIPFSPALLADLYPSHGAYVARVRTAALRAARAGFVLLPDARETVAEALAAPVP